MPFPPLSTGENKTHPRPQTRVGWRDGNVFSENEFGGSRPFGQDVGEVAKTAFQTFMIAGTAQADAHRMRRHRAADGEVVSRSHQNAPPPRTLREIPGA